MRWTCAVALSAAVGVGGVLALGPRPPGSPTGDGAARVREVREDRVSYEALVDAARAHAVESVAPGAGRWGGAPGAGTGDGTDTATADPLQTLLAALRDLDRRAPAAFHDRAPEPMATFVLDDAAAGCARRLLEVFDGDTDSEQVRGALLACAAACGRVEEVAARRPPAGELHRAGWMGVGWSPDGEAEDDALRLDPGEFLAVEPRGGHPVLALPLGRAPGPAERAELFGQVLEPVADAAGQLDRDLAVLVLGTAVDLDDDVFGFLRGLLLGTSLESLRLRPAVAFVLCRSRRPEARQAVHAFLADASLGDRGRTVARWWLGRSPAMDGDLAAILAPLHDPESTTTDRIAAVGSLLPRLGSLDPDDALTVEEVLALRVAEETDATARLATVTVLARLDGGWIRMNALDGVLRRDDSAPCRSWAAKGLSFARGRQAAEARSLLLGALPRESDPDVRADIEQALLHLP